MRTGNGDIDIMITIYPHTPKEKGSRFDRAISRQLSIMNLDSLGEMRRIGKDVGDMTVATVLAMIDTLTAQEDAEVAASQVVQAEELDKLYAEGVVVVEELPE